MQIDSLENSDIMTLSYLISGASKTGKTSLFKSVLSQGALLINSENNLSSLYGLKVNKIDVFTLQKLLDVLTWLEAMPIQNRPKWLFIDSITDLMTKIFNELRDAEKDKRNAYTEFEGHFEKIIVRLKSLGINLVCIGQQGSVKDEVTGGQIFGCMMPWAKIENKIPFKFDCVLSARILIHEGKQYYMLQCEGDNQYSCGIRKPEGKGLEVNQFEPQDLLALHKKILT